MSRQERTLEATARSIAAAVARRDALIFALHRDGLSLRQIAALAGVSHQTVATIIIGQQQQTQ